MAIVIGVSGMGAQQKLQQLTAQLMLATEATATAASDAAPKETHIWGAKSRINDSTEGHRMSHSRRQGATATQQSVTSNHMNTSVIYNATHWHLQ